MMQVVVLGAAGQLGREVVRVLAAYGHTVFALVRRPPVPTFESTVQPRMAAARDEKQLRSALRDADVVVNTIGGGTLRRNDVESSTTTIALAAARSVGVNRYIAMSAAMVVLDWKFFKYVLSPLIFKNILAEHVRVEEVVTATALNWTIVRPPKLTNGPPRGYLASLQLRPRSFSATRADVAAFIADEVGTGVYTRQAVFVGLRSAKSGVHAAGTDHPRGFVNTISDRLIRLH